MAKAEFQIQKISPNTSLIGQLVDSHTRCVHYHTELDIIAIKFKCCNNYYPCFKCHQESTSHQPDRLDKNDNTTKAVFCGNCMNELTVVEYLNCGYTCTYCGGQFNPGCSLHYELYFNNNDH
ncbi:medator of assembly of small mitochondrial TIM (Translocase of the Inner Membrane) complexes, putative [Candida dubliniensis CD36]|uniref:Mitochondrial intermembrane space protein, putative n=1 Tax=Candida dubliniensis (strain CD36 / ATCC MYA-646 / CBS 7987 / NCPF 3949 / NRRL Y-17841) TaxID=573826 RepID=B9WK54_CANDC|nr:medator of assembly of small mitochondrial TIM (Translocase of the Inner Membrane) complexes, putative [Candida dubliniensis CD36]CAX40705.1 medator of assembly of small mitochondrial TIM (Translocase of the Inner Membrane) complexes, putative [Candida dubliniensis CD36]